MIPADLDGKDGPAVARELFGEAITDEGWWSLARADDRSFEWRDKRLGINWRATQGYLVGLHEVSTLSQASEFGGRNNIRLLKDGGLIFRACAELFIRCAPMPSPELVRSETDLYRVRTRSGIEASVGYASTLFARLIGRTAAEENEALPDPSTLTTVVIHGVDRDSVSKIAEVVLYHLRNGFAGMHFSFWPLQDYQNAPPFANVLDDPAPAGLLDLVTEPVLPEAVAFFNRASESEPIAGFLYLYRVIEACFDVVLNAEVRAWRVDANVDEQELLRQVRKLQQKEDKWALRRVLGEVVDQPLLDRAHSQGLIAVASVDALTEELYTRRNSIAHGRRGQHDRVLVPNYFSSDDERVRDRAWYDAMRSLADRVMAKWILR